MVRKLLLSLAFVAAVPASAQGSPDHAQLADPQGEPIVVGSIHRLQSSVYGDEQIVTVRLPRGYGDNPDKKYPVLLPTPSSPMVK